MAACTAAGITPRFSHRASDWTAVIALAAAGAGIALVPALALGGVHPGVAAIPVGPQTPARSTCSAVRGGSAVRSGSAAAPHIAAVLTALRTVAPGSGESGLW